MGVGLRATKPETLNPRPRGGGGGGIGGVGCRTR